ncbi:MAG: type III-A CRISPR-associated protein Csm2 [Bacillota bacterium]
MSDKIKGRVKFYNSSEGYGFIEREDGKKDVHMGSDSFSGKAPSDGDPVEFEVKNTGKGTHAVNVKVVEDEVVSFLKENVLWLEDVEYDEFCDTTLEYAEKLKDGGMTTSMIRKIYSRIMNSDTVRDIKILRPQFAYTAGRNDESGVKSFMNLLDSLARKMEQENETQLENFKTFMEAVVAYRKYVGNDK